MRFFWLKDFRRNGKWLPHIQRRSPDHECSNGTVSRAQLLDCVSLAPGSCGQMNKLIRVPVPTISNVDAKLRVSLKPAAIPYLSLPHQKFYSEKNPDRTSLRVCSHCGYCPDPSASACSPVDVPVLPGSATVQMCEQYYAGSLKQYRADDWETIVETFFENGTLKDMTTFYDGPSRSVPPRLSRPVYTTFRLVGEAAPASVRLLLALKLIISTTKKMALLHARYRRIINASNRVSDSWSDNNWYTRPPFCNRTVATADAGKRLDIRKQDVFTHDVFQFILPAENFSTGPSDDGTNGSVPFWAPILSLTLPPSAEAVCTHIEEGGLLFLPPPNVLDVLPAAVCTGEEHTLTIDGLVSVYITALQ